MYASLCILAWIVITEAIVAIDGELDVVEGSKKGL